MRAISMRSLRLFKQLCGNHTLENVVIVAAWEHGYVPSKEQQQEDLLNVQSFFKSALEQKAQLLLHDNTESSAHEVLHAIFSNRPAPLLIQRELADERKGLWVTQAGIEIRKQMEELMKDLQQQNTMQRSSKELRKKLDKLNADFAHIQKSLQEAHGAKVSVVL
jgi:flagellar capping protein FliD